MKHQNQGLPNPPPPDPLDASPTGDKQIHPETFINKRWQMDPQDAEKLKQALGGRNWAELMNPEGKAGRRQKLVETFTQKALDEGLFEKLKFEPPGGPFAGWEWRFPPEQQAGITGFFRRTAENTVLRLNQSGHEIAATGYSLLASGQRELGKMRGEKGEPLIQAADRNLGKAIGLKAKAGMLRLRLPPRPLK